MKSSTRLLVASKRSKPKAPKRSAGLGSHKKEEEAKDRSSIRDRADAPIA